MHVTVEGPDAISHSELEGRGEALGAQLSPGDVVALQGDLGSGKTTLVQAICRGYGVTEDVTSPTFAIVHQYAAPKSPVYHFDLYRVKSEGELDQLGFDEILAREALTLIEWPERAIGRIPESATRIALAHIEGRPELRSFRLARGT